MDMKRYIVICHKNGEIAHKIFNDKLDAMFYDWEKRMEGYTSRIEEY